MTGVKPQCPGSREGIIPQPDSKLAVKAAIDPAKSGVILDGDILRDELQPVRAAHGLLVGGELVVVDRCHLQSCIHRAANNSWPRSVHVHVRAGRRF